MESQLRPPNLPLSLLDLENLRVWRYQAIESITEIPFTSADPGNYAQQVAYLRGQISIIDMFISAYTDQNEEIQNEHASNTLN